MIFAVFTLPKSVTADILFMWLGLRDLGVFDSAVCMTKVRTKFEELLRAAPLRLVETDFRWTISIVTWVVRRNIPLRELFVGKELVEMTDSLERQLLQLIGNTLRAITVDRSVDSEWANTFLLNLCTYATNVDSCIVNTSVTEGSACVLLAKNCGLRVVYLKGHRLLNRVVGFGVANHLTHIILPKEASETALDLFLDQEPSNLQTLCLPMCEVSETAFLKLQTLTNLRTLHISYLLYHNLEGCIFHGMLYLRTGMRTMDTATFATIAKAFPGLTMLTFDTCSTLLTTNMLMEALSLFPKLRQLSVHPIDSDDSIPVPLSKIAQTTSMQFTLEKLSANVKVDFDFQRVLLMCPALCELRLHNLPVLAASTTRVEIQRLWVLCRGCIQYDDSVAMIYGLRELVLENCYFLTDKGLSDLARNNPQLHTLKLQNIGPGSKAENVSYRGLMAFLEHCPLLTSVTYLMNVYNDKGSSSFEADVCFEKMMRKLYRNLKHFECNIV